MIILPFLDDLNQWAKAQGPSYWVVILSVLMLACMTGYVLHHPRYVERLMARRRERQEIADIVSAALQDAAHRKIITSEVWHKYNKKLALSLGLPDMIPKKPRNLNLLKKQIIERLYNTGVNVAGYLKLRRVVRSKKVKPTPKKA